MGQKHKASYSREVTRVAEWDQTDGDQMVHEHLPKIFAPYVGELTHQKWQVEAKLENVVPVDVVT